MKVNDHFHMYICYEARSGEDILFWNDIWCDGSPLEVYFPRISIASDGLSFIEDNFERLGDGVWSPRLRIILMIGSGRSDCFYWVCWGA